MYPPRLRPLLILHERGDAAHGSAARFAAIAKAKDKARIAQGAGSEPARRHPRLGDVPLYSFEEFFMCHALLVGNRLDQCKRKYLICGDNRDTIVLGAQ